MYSVEQKKPPSFDEKFELHTCPRRGYTLGVAAFPDEISGPETDPPGKKFHRQPTKRLLLTLRNELLVSIPFKNVKSSRHRWILDIDLSST